MELVVLKGSVVFRGWKLTEFQRSPAKPRLHDRPGILLLHQEEKKKMSNQVAVGGQQEDCLPHSQQKDTQPWKCAVGKNQEERHPERHWVGAWLAVCPHHPLSLKSPPYSHLSQLCYSDKAGQAHFAKHMEKSKCLRESHLAPFHISKGPGHSHCCWIETAVHVLCSDHSLMLLLGVSRWGFTNRSSHRRSSSWSGNAGAEAYTREYLPTILSSSEQSDGPPLHFVPSKGLSWAFIWVVRPGCNHLMGSPITPPVSTLWIASKVRLTGDSNFLMGRICYQVRPWAWIFETVWVRQLGAERIKVSHPLVLVRFPDSPEDGRIKFLAPSHAPYIQNPPAPTVCKKEWTLN